MKGTTVRLLSLASMLFIAVGTVALAAVTAVGVDPEPLYVAQETTYTPQEDGQGPMLASGSWEVGAVGCSPAQKFQAVPGDQTGYIRRETQVGSFAIRFHPFYQDANGNMFEGTTITRSVTVIGPDRDSLETTFLDFDSSVNANHNSSDLFVAFSVLAGSRPQLVDMVVDGFPQERIRRPQFGFDSGFQNPSESFYLTYLIEDIKSVGLQKLDFLSTQVNDVFDDFYQQNRMVIKDGCGNNQYYYFTERHFQKKKTSDTTWKLVLAQ